MIIFLDIDGVCHPHPPRAGRLFGATQMQALDAALAAVGAEVVIISTWREEMDIEPLKAMLGDVGRYVIGVAGEEPAFTSTPRESLVEEWLVATGNLGEAWAAVDDRPGWYGIHSQRVIATDPRHGFTQADGERLQALAKRLSTR
jgi:hypothetical protein